MFKIYVKPKLTWQIKCRKLVIICPWITGKKKERKTTITINIDKVRRHEIIETELFVDDVIIHHENLKQYTEKLRNNENI